jgi:membrane protein
MVLRWLLLSYSNIDIVYGTSGSIVLLLLFVFYSALILYFGAAFTKIWAAHSGNPIRPLPHAMSYELSDIEVEQV